MPTQIIKSIDYKVLFWIIFVFTIMAISNETTYERPIDRQHTFMVYHLLFGIYQKNTYDNKVTISESIQGLEL